MPLDEYRWIHRQEVLSFEEIERLARLFIGLGVSKVRLTGGEPLVRKDLHLLIRCLTRLYDLADVSVTTNGALLEEQAVALRAAGLRRINVGLDTLNPDRFVARTKRGNLDEVLRGISAAQKAGFSPIKINAVIIRGINEDEILDLVEFARSRAFQMRFIEYMDVGNANGWNLGTTVTKKCSNCTRVRLTADGKLVTCLFAESGFDLKGILRSSATDNEIRNRIEQIWSLRADRFSDNRWENLQKGTYQPRDHKKIEMITLGG
jgi:GTP 3',8-cyclase